MVRHRCRRLDGTVRTRRVEDAQLRHELAGPWGGAPRGRRDRAREGSRSRRDPLLLDGRQRSCRGRELVHPRVTVVQQYARDALGVRAAPRGPLRLACHHSPAASWLGVPACELAPADGHEPPPTDLRAQAPLAICSGAQRASRSLTPRLAAGQRTDRGGHLRGRSTRRIRHEVPPSRSLTASTHSLVREGSPLGEDQPRRFPGQTWSGRSGHVQTEAPKSTSRPWTLAPSPPIVNWGRLLGACPMLLVRSGRSRCACRIGLCGERFGGASLRGEACCDGGSLARGGANLDCSVE